MSLTAPARQLTPMEQWRGESEEVTRGDLVAVIRAMLRSPLRTWNEQQALLVLIDRVDYPGTVDASPLRTEAANTWLRAHVCDCGVVSTGYWCSTACHRADEPGAYETDDDYADEDGAA